MEAAWRCGPGLEEEGEEVRAWALESSSTSFQCLGGGAKSPLTKGSGPRRQSKGRRMRLEGPSEPWPHFPGGWGEGEQPFFCNFRIVGLPPPPCCDSTSCTPAKNLSCYH